LDGCLATYNCTLVVTVGSCWKLEVLGVEDVDVLCLLVERRHRLRVGGRKERVVMSPGTDRLRSSPTEILVRVSADRRVSCQRVFGHGFSSRRSRRLPCALIA